MEYRELRSGVEWESSTSVRERVVAARKTQTERFKGLKISSNAHMGTRHLKKFCPLDADGESIMEMAMQELSLEARAHHKIRRVVRTIADLESSERITAAHVARSGPVPQPR